MLTLLLFLYCTASPSIEVLSVEPCPISSEIWFPLHLDGFDASVFEGTGIAASRFSDSPPITNLRELWSIVEGSGGSFTCEPIDVSGVPVITVFQPADGGGCRALACVSGADTLWTCLFDDMDDFENDPVVAGSQEYGYLLSSNSDCGTFWTRIARITPQGEIVFSTALTSLYLLDLQEQDGELGPSVSSLEISASGDVIVAGRVSQWFTSFHAWFICLLDGETGAPIWRATGAGMGLAGLHQVIETPSGVLIGVGTTSAPGNQEYPWIWGEKSPLLVVVGLDGTVLGETVPDLGTVSRLTGIAPLADRDEFLIAGVDSVAAGMALARVKIVAGQ